MADILTLNADEKDIGKVVAVIRQLVERFQPSEDVATDAAAAAAAAVQTSRQIISGNGLTGGGDLSADRTLAVGAGTGITVNADDVAISADGVTNALLANMANSTIKGRTTAGTGDPEDLTAAQALAIIEAAITTGSWTPDLQFGGAKVGITYSTQQGLYIRIGRFVHCQGFINLTSKGSSTGAATIAGLPFTTTATTYSMAPIAYATFNTTPAYMQVPPSGTSLTVLKPSGAGGATSAQDTDFTNTSSMLLSVQFMKD